MQHNLRKQTMIKFGSMVNKSNKRIHSIAPEGGA